MNTLTKGALSMIIAGSVTFSITNSVLVGQLAKSFTENALIVYRDLTKIDVIRPVEKRENDKKQTNKVQESGTKLSLTETAPKASKPKDDMVATGSQGDSQKSSTIPASTKEKTTTPPAGKTVSAPSTKAPVATTPSKSPGNKNTTTKAPSKPEGNKGTTGATEREKNSVASTKKSAPAAEENNNKSAAATSPSRGQAVSEAAKEQAAKEKEKNKNENNGKNK